MSGPAPLVSPCPLHFLPAASRPVLTSRRRHQGALDSLPQSTLLTCPGEGPPKLLDLPAQPHIPTHHRTGRAPGAGPGFLAQGGATCLPQVAPYLHADGGGGGMCAEEGLRGVASSVS